MIAVPHARPFLLILAAAISATAAAGRPPASPAPSVPTVPAYGQVADLAIKSPVVVEVVVRKAKRLKGADLAGAKPGTARFLVDANVVKLLRGDGTVPAQLTYLYDAPLDARGKLPSLRKFHALLFARAVAGHANQLQLSGNGGQLAWSAQLESLARDIIRDVLRPDAPPAVTGVGNVFHVAGTLPGEGETQIFLTTADSRPISVSVLQRPGELRRWAVALGEIVDESAGPPAQNTFLWYRLACGLPRELPPESLTASTDADAAVARDDYAFVLQSLGPCRPSTG